MAKRIMISAGEVSGDLYASHLVLAIKKIESDTVFFGMGGEKMAAAGVKIICDLSSRNTIGLVEILPNLLSVFGALNKMKELLSKEKPDLFVLIDSQGFNVPLANEAKKLGIKTCYFIPPQEWLWGTEKNLKKVAAAVGSIVSIFKKEYEAYKKFNPNTQYFGHPLLEIVKPTMDKPTAKKLFFGDGAKQVVALCPGSRKQEIETIFPHILGAAKLMKQNYPRLGFIVPIAAEWAREKIESSIAKAGIEAKLVSGNSYDVLNCADLVIATSGTINLESTILKIPNIMVYKIHPLTYWIATKVLKIDKKLPFFSMPNLLAGKKIIPEITQKHVSAENIFFEAKILLGKKVSPEFEKVLAKLGQPPILNKIANFILQQT